MNRKALTIVLAIAVVQVVAVLAFVLPAHSPKPHHLPIGVAGPAAAVTAVGGQLERSEPGAFDIRSYPSAAAAEAAIRDREVYGAIVAQPGGEPRLLVASAASPAVAQMLRQGVGAPAERVRDVVPIDEDDPRGATINALFLPLIIASLPAALLLGRLPLSGRALLGALALLAPLGGLAVIAAVGPGIGALPGPFLALAGVAALIVLAMALPAAGLFRLMGPPGIALAALTFLFIGNPGSGNGSAPELLPGFWRAVGPLLPPGAGGTALRNTAYFDGAALTRPLLVLGAFAAAGALLILVAERRRQPAAAAETSSSGTAPARTTAQAPSVS